METSRRQIMAEKSKVESEKNVEFAKGGSDNHMFGEQAATPDKPGNTGKDAGGAPGAKFASGGSGKMFGFNPSVPATAGQTGAR
jgi:hypothetical protein